MKKKIVILIFIQVVILGLKGISQTFYEIPTNLINLKQSSVDWGDYDNDNDLDIIVLGNDGTNNITKVYRNDAGIYTDINVSLFNIAYGTVTWGDYDNDNDLDILVVGDNGSACVSKIFRNDGNDIFTDTNIDFTTDRYGAVVWGDYDNDNDLDILLSGNLAKVYRYDNNDTYTETTIEIPGSTGGSAIWGDYDADNDLDIAIVGGASYIYRNDGNDIFTNINANITYAYTASIAWGDYDNDNDLDLLLCGDLGAMVGVTEIYKNEGNDVFTNTNIELVEVGYGSVAWGDYDLDNDLDILITGSTSVYNDIISKIYRNDNNDIFTDINVNLLGVHYSSAKWGDFDGDSDLDILLSGSSIGYPWNENTKIYQSDIVIEIGINEESESNKDLIKLYPNPTKNTFVVKGINKGELSIINLQGEVIKTNQLLSANAIVDVSSLCNGSYYVRILTSESIVMRKLIKE